VTIEKQIKMIERKGIGNL